MIAKARKPSNAGTMGSPDEDRNSLPGSSICGTSCSARLIRANIPEIFPLKRLTFLRPAL